jgi:hypothetical protein
VKYGLIAVALGMVLAGAAHAGPQSGPGLMRGEPKAHSRPTLNFRLVSDSEFDPDPVHHSGMVAQSEIGPNATVGIGLLKAAPKKPGSGDWKLDNGIRHSRKAAVSFRLKF